MGDSLTHQLKYRISALLHDDVCKGLMCVGDWVVFIWQVLLRVATTGKT